MGIETKPAEEIKDDKEYREELIQHLETIQIQKEADLKEKELKSKKAAEEKEEQKKEQKRKEEQMKAEKAEKAEKTAPAETGTGSRKKKQG